MARGCNSLQPREDKQSSPAHATLSLQSNLLFNFIVSPTARRCSTRGSECTHEFMLMWTLCVSHAVFFLNASLPIHTYFGFYLDYSTHARLVTNFDRPPKESKDTRTVNASSCALATRIADTLALRTMTADTHTPCPAHERTHGCSSVPRAKL